MKASNRIVVDSLTSQESQIMSLEQRVKKLEESYQLTDLRAQVERLQADGAVMRGALESCCFVMASSEKTFSESKVRKALSTSCGADLLARVKELEKSLLNEQSKHAETSELAQAQLHQRDTALVAAREALESASRCIRSMGFTTRYPIVKEIDHALSQIQACEVKPSDSQQIRKQWEKDATT